MRCCVKWVPKYRKKYNMYLLALIFEWIYILPLITNLLMTDFTFSSSCKQSSTKKLLLFVRSEQNRFTSPAHSGESAILMCSFFFALTLSAFCGGLSATGSAFLAGLPAFTSGNNGETLPGTACSPKGGARLLLEFNSVAEDKEMWASIGNSDRRIHLQEVISELLCSPWNTLVNVQVQQFFSWRFSHFLHEQYSRLWWQFCINTECNLYKLKTSLYSCTKLGLNFLLNQNSSAMLWAK